MELRVRDGRAVLAGEDDSGEREVDPHSLPLGADLAEALHEWAKVADAVVRTESPSDGVARALIARRGKQLAGRLAAVMNSPVSYTDPVSGDLLTVDAPEVPVEAAFTAEPEAEPEPTPWGTGLTVSVITAAIVTVTVVSLSLGLGETSRWLALVANVLVVGGLAPSVWLGRNVPVWRWVAYGVVTGVLVAWLALILTLL
ncbi:DUF2537 domain-containing protein [Lentzea flaviverrucosa]|uniref:DUF2537 domain-containing protein n=1 Tax=Lentzea flaviverrucosa TaxID=200379 RepID=A0A1H9LVJ2_9PSEU|nr:DUF2537 domain-containing protein [Lentzea flaviverrucosa]RDI31172.1 uncharacterized protein DUF2537 [Lentzea flaviverrucosa]SER15461.1 Protein of unknown function [Lentzea flaviverrucosa]